MFAAKPHPLLVPCDGSFDVRKAPTAPDKDKDKDHWQERLEDEVKKLGDAQQLLYAEGRHAVLVVLQALDAAGKDGTIRHVFTGVNPAGLHVAAFKQPTRLELAHDFLWRTTPHLPERGSIAIFNRSYYEEVLVVRVHPELLAPQKLPEPAPPTFWDDRLRAIADHERYLAEQGTVILKFWLNISKAEQRKQLLERIEEPNKNWKFNSGDVDERELWDEYLEAYGQALRATSRPWAPWYAVPADDKHYLRWQVAKLVNDALAAARPRIPAPRQSGARRVEQSERTNARAAGLSLSQYRPRRPASLCLSSSSCAGVPVNSRAGTLGSGARQRAEDLVRREHVQALPREVLKPQVPIRVARRAVAATGQAIRHRPRTCS